MVFQYTFFRSHHLLSNILNRQNALSHSGRVFEQSIVSCYFKCSKFNVNTYKELTCRKYSTTFFSSIFVVSEIQSLLITKKTSEEIAQVLSISKHTVDTHRRNILKKLNLTSTVELITYFKTNPKLI